MLSLRCTFPDDEAAVPPYPIVEFFVVSRRTYLVTRVNSAISFDDRRFNYRVFGNELLCFNELGRAQVFDQCSAKIVVDLFKGRIPRRPPQAFTVNARHDCLRRVEDAFCGLSIINVIKASVVGALIVR